MSRLVVVPGVVFSTLSLYFFYSLEDCQFLLFCSQRYYLFSFRNVFDSSMRTSEVSFFSFTKYRYLSILQIKFHILSHQRLAKCCQNSDISSLCYLNMEQLMKCLLSLFDMYHVIHKSNSHSNKEAEFYSFYVLLHLGYKIPKMGGSLSLWFCQLALPIIQSKEMLFARAVLRCYHLGNFKHFFRIMAAEATDLQLCLVEPFLNEARATALMYFNHSGYKLQHHPLTHLSRILMIEESELEHLCTSCGLEICKDEGLKVLPPKQTSFCLPTPISRSNGIYIPGKVGS